jgi:pimeloyl-ACP methyl ester carboxylesterase
MLEIIGALGVFAALVPLSYLIEALRRAPAPPASLPWAPDIPVRWVAVDGVRLRYIVVGSGPPLVLLHTLRTQLDLFQRVIPALARRYQVYALDYPGHGHSDIPAVDYKADLFINTVSGFLQQLGIEKAVLVGESIGATIALALAARRDLRVRAVVAISTYDYDRGRGTLRASALSRLLFSVNDVPVLGGTVMRLRSYPIVKAVFEGGLHRLEALPSPLAREMYQVGNRSGHYQAFMSLVHHWPTWEAVRERYGDIDCPVLLLYGDHDWSRPDERAETARLIPGAEVRTVNNAGHFLSFDAPSEMIEQVVEFVERRFHS